MKILQQLRAMFSKGKLDADMTEEMRLHLEQRERENLTAGMSPEEARYAAYRKFGGVEQAKELARAQRAGRWLEDAVQDLRYGVRQLRRNPGFAATAIAILALGIGATTAIFSVVHGVMLKPLPYEQPGQLVQIWETPKPGMENQVSVGVFDDWRTQATQFEGFSAYARVALNLTGNGEPERITGLRMTANCLQLLRARPLFGRTFAPDEDQPGRDKVVVITHQLWQRRFGSDPAVVGRSVQLNDEPYTVIGVLPAGFLPFDAQQFVVPFVFDPSWREQRGSHRLRVIARLKPEVTLAVARAELAAISDRNRALLPLWKREWGTSVDPLQEELAERIRPALLLLLGAVALVLLIACANVANLLLARASARQREIAVRGALGASRTRILRQLLAESLLLAVSGAGLGLVLAAWSVGGLRHLLGTMNIARAHEVALDPLVLGAAIATALGTGLLFGLAPAWQASRPNLQHALKDAARGSGASGSRLRGALIVAEVSLALMLLIGAGLLLHSFARVLRVPIGFDPTAAVAMQVTLSDQRYPNPVARIAFHRRMLERVTALPGVAAAAVNGSLALHGPPGDRFFLVAGHKNLPPEGHPADYDFITEDFFAAMGAHLRRGRQFTAQEVQTPTANVAIVNETFAREVFGHEDPIGRSIGHGDQMWEIVGIVADVRVRSLTFTPRAMVYRPLSSGDGTRSATLTVRTSGAPLARAEEVRRAIREIDPALPVANISTLEQIVADSVSQRRLTLGLLGAFAVVALLLAAIGLYGVIAYAVTQRTREFGIRFALGASRAQVRSLVLGQGMKLAALGVVIGLVGAFILARLIDHLLYDTKPTDPLTFGAVSLLLLAVALVASWLPARRAAKTDPMVALRAE